ncbi:MAG: glycerophosphodiester phosphodiesterase [Flavobacteriaceae bacterium]
MKNTPKTVAILLTIFFMQCQTDYQPEIIGHRGARGHLAENTLPSIQKALDLGVDGIEIDIFRCATGELVVFHDQTLDQLTDSQGYIEQYSLDSLRRVNVLGGYQIPTLDEVMERIDGKVRLNIELKGSNTALTTNKTLERYFNQSQTNWSPEKVFVSSFNWEELQSFRTLNPVIPIAILTEDDPLDALSIAQQLNAFAINPDYKTLNKNNVTKIHEAGFALYPWTVNEIDDIEKMKTLRVEGIITDYPERISTSKKP